MQWTSAALAGALVATAGIAAAPVAQGQMPRPAAQVLSGFGRSSQIGVTVHDSDVVETKAGAAGVVVDEVGERSAAEKAGIKDGDRIIEFDGERVRSARQFARVVQETVPGRTVPLVLTRGDQRLTVNVTPEAGSEFGMRLLDAPEVWRTPTPPAAPRVPRPAPAPTAPPAPFAFDLFTRTSRLGVAVESLNGQLAVYFGVKQGALVKSVADESSAAKAGLKAGDVITAIDGNQVDDPSDIARELRQLDDGATVTIDIVRDRKPQTLKGKLEDGPRARYRTIS
jgi:serine protease Do